MQTVHLQTLFVLSLAFVNVIIISLVMRNVGREAGVGEVKMVLKKRDRVRRMRTVHLLTLSALSLAFVSASRTNQEMLIAGKGVKVRKEKKQAKKKRRKTQQQKKK